VKYPINPRNDCDLQMSLKPWENANVEIWIGTDKICKSGPEKEKIDGSEHAKARL